MNTDDLDDPAARAERMRDREEVLRNLLEALESARPDAQVTQPIPIVNLDDQEPGWLSRH